jgi:hypothetical protein
VGQRWPRLLLGPRLFARRPRTGHLRGKLLAFRDLTKKRISASRRGERPSPPESKSLQPLPLQLIQLSAIL